MLILLRNTLNVDWNLLEGRKTLARAVCQRSEGEERARHAPLCVAIVAVDAATVLFEVSVLDVIVPAGAVVLGYVLPVGVHCAARQTLDGVVNLVAGQATIRAFGALEISIYRGINLFDVKTGSAIAESFDISQIAVPANTSAIHEVHALVASQAALRITGPAVPAQCAPFAVVVGVVWADSTVPIKVKGILKAGASVHDRSVFELLPNLFQIHNIDVPHRVLLAIVTTEFATLAADWAFVTNRVSLVPKIVLLRVL